MTNGDFIQSRVYRGYGIAAQKLGGSYQFYRPSGGTFPQSPIFTRNVSLNAEDMKYSKPNKYGKATWYALFDGNGAQAGDYFFGPEGTFFIAAMQALLPILAVECNRTVTLSRVASPDFVGVGGYGGMTPTNEAAFAQGFPCSILQGTKGEKNDSGLPGDTRLPWYSILMPAQVGGVQYGDLIVDDLGNRYVTSSVELTDLGYRLTAAMAKV